VAREDGQQIAAQDIPPMFGKTTAFGKKQPQPASLTQPAGSQRDPEPEFPNARKAGKGLMSLGNGMPEPEGAYAQIARLIANECANCGKVHPETALSSIGAIAGFSAQQAIREGPIREGKLAANQGFLRAETKDGGVYYLGGLLTTILSSTQEGHLSIWRLVAGAALNEGANTLPDLAPLFAASARKIGFKDFGLPVWDTTGVLMEPPREALRHWPQVRAVLTEAKIPPLHWPLELGRSAQVLIGSQKYAIPPEKAALIIMEAAINMSKIDPRSIPCATADE